MTKIDCAWIDDLHLLTVHLKNIASHFDEQQPPTIYWKKNEQYFHVQLGKIIDHSTCHMTYSEPLPMGEQLMLLWGEREIPVYPRKIVQTDWFEEHYTQTTIELGAHYETTATTFIVWAPTATSVQLSLDNHLLPLQQQSRGIWQSTISGDWHGFAYHYEAMINGEIVIVNDPYAKAMLANSEHSVVVDLDKTNPTNFHSTERPTLQHLADAIIYELHIRDATIDKHSGVNHRGKFLGLTEEDTATNSGYSTGISYVKELGCTHIQLLPINDFGRVDELNSHESYNWGYDPLYFQVPEGSYSTDPAKPMTRIHEFKQLIQSFHQAGISVILDVVYNHVFIMEESPFEQLVPGYYFRYHPDGTLSNGTGVGNDLATERKMVRKFILDTIDFWLREYKVDGFRFDLMGAMDIETMRCIRNRCLQESTPIMLLGEGWQLDTALDKAEMATSTQSGKLPGIRFFNDYFRDTLKGNLFDVHDTGYINGRGHFIDRLPHLVTGSSLEEYGTPFVTDVNQTVNFVECHDNHTLWDRLSLTNHAESTKVRKKMHQLATGITLLSQGVPFIHAGQEWFRTKNGDENSYISGDEINQLDWNQRVKECENIAFIKALICLRKQYDVFRLSTQQEVRRRVHVLKTPVPLFGWCLLDHHVDLAIYINPTKSPVDVHLPSSGKWEVIVTNVDDQARKWQANKEYTAINPYELVAFKKTINEKNCIQS